MNAQFWDYWICNVQFFPPWWSLYDLLWIFLLLLMHSRDHCFMSYFKEEEQGFFSFRLLKLLSLASSTLSPANCRWISPITLQHIGKFCDFITTHILEMLFLIIEHLQYFLVWLYRIWLYQVMPFMNIKKLWSHILRSVTNIFISFILLPLHP